MCVRIKKLGEINLLISKKEMTKKCSLFLSKKWLKLNDAPIENHKVRYSEKNIFAFKNLILLCEQSCRVLFIVQYFGKKFGCCCIDLN